MKSDLTRFRGDYIILAIMNPRLRIYILFARLLYSY
jgi:hypothetical protein